MKRLFLLGIVTIVTLGSCMSQSRKFDKLCQKYEEVEGVKTFRINGLGCMFASLFVGGEESGVENLVRSCSSCQLLIYDGTECKELAREVKSHIHSNPLEELMTIKEQGKEIRIYVEDRKDKIRQFFITVMDGPKTVVIHLQGKFSRNKIQKLMASVSEIK